MTHPLRFWLTRETLMGCTDPLSSRGVGAPHQCPLGVGSKLPLPLDADVHTYILMTQHIPLGTSAPQVGRRRAGSFLFYILKKKYLEDGDELRAF